MSDSLGNRPGGDQGGSSRMSDENQDHATRYEGFEGMNYEQVRQPYDPQHNDRKHSGSENQGNSNRNENV